MKCHMPTSKHKKSAVWKKVPLTIIGNANTAVDIEKVDTADTNSENIASLLYGFTRNRHRRSMLAYYL